MVFDLFLFSLLLDLVLGQKCQVNILDTTEYVGCFVDSYDRLLPHWAWPGPSPDNSRCILLCRDYGYMFAGTQNYGECHCGNDPWRYTATDVDSVHIQDYDCNNVCPADPTQICGGFWRLSVYRTGVNNDTSQIIQSGKTQRQFTRMGKDKKIDGSKTAVTSLKAESSIACATLCSIHETCTGIVYSVITGSCQLYYLKYYDLCDYTVNEGGSNVYVVD